jgi:MtrB/PioB family decaheme-associated outer membrane protein
MRSLLMHRFRISMVSLFVVAPVVAAAQTQEPPRITGAIDFGIRGTSLSGDAARYERYRDLGDGLALEGVRLSRERRGWLFDFMADHVARNDQRFRGDIVRPGRVKAWLQWDQIPMLLSRTTRTLFSETSPGVLEIDNALQAQVQATPAAIAGVFDDNAVQFETKSRRHIFDTGFEYLATSELTVKGQVRRTDRQGTLPYGGSFGHSSVVELAAPVQHSMTDVDASAEFLRDRLLLRAGYVGSWFHNDVTSVTFDNPFRALDISSASSRGRLTLAPSNSFIGVNGTASVRLPYRSRATAYVSTGMLKDAGDPLVPQTVNSALTPTPLDRSTVDGEARTTAVRLSFTSRPTRLLDINVRFSGYDYDNHTPEFTLTQRVSYDNSTGAATYGSLGGQTSAVGSVVTEPFGLGRAMFDADVRATPSSGLTAGIGYSRIGEERTHRALEHTTDHILRLTFDSVAHPMFTVRTKYEHGQRRGEITDEFARELFMIGEQPGIRHFDLASRDRNRVTVIGSVTPVAEWSVNATLAAGKDDYLESLFGLRDNTHRVVGIGVDGVPREFVNVSGSYTYERYNALSRSRQANPPAAAAAFDYDRFLELSAQTNPGVQVADASRNWATDASDRTHSVMASAEFNRIAEKFDVRVNYDLSRARALYTYTTGAVGDRTLPEEIVVDTTLPLPTQLPVVKSSLQRGTMDVIYALTTRVSIGLSYWHERFSVTDFTLDADANPALARGQALLLGYLYRPYTANTIWGRLFYRF